MNRQQKRNLGRQAEKSVTYNLSESQVKQIANKEIQREVSDIRTETINYATNCMISSFVIALHYEMGYGVKRLTRVLDSVNEQFDAVSNGTITEEELLKCCESIGIRVVQKEVTQNDWGFLDKRNRQAK